MLTRKVLMTHIRRAQILAFLAALALIPIRAQERVDLNAIHKIREEALQNSKVMNHVFQLTDVYGPRLTNSPQFRAAGEWAVKQLKEFGLDNVKLEKWGPFGRGWAYTYYSGYIEGPEFQPLIG
ncbi:MAG TPA: hypothetical protein VE958_01375, partial [Bryobacteraceae bacterium]|nr:hypothetical protein [Bryobacteraceae bacterium]